MRLKIQNLGKQYHQDFWGLKEFNLEINSGVIGILGPNGAGKSTLFKILATVSNPTTGSFSWDGQDVSKNKDSYRQQLGYLPQDFGIYPNLTAEEFLNFISATRGIIGKQSQERITKLLDLVNLSEARKRKLKSMSGGMKQRVGIAQALLNDPQLLIVDEPTAGLDPEERIRFRNLLGELANDRVVLLSSHIVSDIEAVASQVAVVAKGQLLFFNTLSELIKLVKDMVFEIETTKEQLDNLKSHFIISSTVHTEHGLKARLIGSAVQLPNALQVNPNLEDAYLYCLNKFSKEPQHA